ncbi:hypothetical protein V2S66_20325 [Streptomyces sp. V4-01]|uniref:Gram-positive cocci surface proteins LPxTG domain-containing protein n=1 Tax=Actinacidiphila polyblastidii TaxID=3110430 RepID=A0ABU7PER5_9ACTN|nr:hypothetical protein [Streptomyces sp. V4-01]
MPYRRTAALAAAVGALAPAVLLTVAGPARADGPTDPTTLPACTDVATAYGDYVQDSLRTTVTGVPRSVAAGDGWHEFSASVANIGGTSLPLVAVHGLAWRETDGGTELGPYARMEVETGGGGWQPLSEGSSGYAAPTVNLAAHSGASYHFRFRITSDAPADVTFGEVAVEGLFADTYRAPDSTYVADCSGDSIGDEGFRITPAGSTATPTASVTPTPTATATAAATATTGATPSATGAVPAASGGAPSTGPQLAATGAPDALPLLAGLGVAALAAGAGTVAAGRRRTR